MPNLRVTVRVPQNIYDQLPVDERERAALQILQGSRLLLRLMEEYYNPKTLESELANLKVRVEALEQRLGKISQSK